jgi:hypothetical protein
MMMVVVLIVVLTLSLHHVRGLDVGEIEFELSGIPLTWEGFPNGMVQPRDSPTHEVDMEFSALAESFSYSIVHADTTVTANDDKSDPVALSSFDGWVLDLWVQHSNVLWPCVAAEGLMGNLRIHGYDSANQRYIVQADYVPNSKGQYFFNSTLTVVPIVPDTGSL